MVPQNVIKIDKTLSRLTENKRIQENKQTNKQRKKLEMKEVTLQMLLPKYTGSGKPTVISTIIWQQSHNVEEISTSSNTQPIKTVSGRNRKSGHTNNE